MPNCLWTGAHHWFCWFSDLWTQTGAISSAILGSILMSHLHILGLVSLYNHMSLYNKHIRMYTHPPLLVLFLFLWRSLKMHLCVLQPYWTQWFVLAALKKKRFLGIDDHVKVIFFISNLYDFNCFSCLIALARTPRIMLTRNYDSGQSFLLLI